MAESVNVLGTFDIAGAVSGRFGSVWLGAVDEFDRGEVLSNSRGTGALQKWDDEEG